MGNIGSVSNAIYSQGWDPVLVSSSSQFEDLSHLIIPGVGSYAAAMRLLGKNKIIESITSFANQGKPILGICLGMQILSDSGIEGGPSKGLGLIGGNVAPLEKTDGLYLPHVGWNEVKHKKKHPVLEGIKPGMDFYFVNSYFFNTSSDKDVISYTEYGQKFPSIVANKNVIGVQFHPEKSQLNGLRMLDNFCLWDGEC